MNEARPGDYTLGESRCDPAGYGPGMFTAMVINVVTAPRFC